MTKGEKFIAIAENEKIVFLSGKEEGYAEGYNAAKEEVKGHTVTIQYVYNWSPVYISKHYPNSEDDYDAVLPKTNNAYENRPTDVKSVVLTDVRELYFWANQDPDANYKTNVGLCASSGGEYLFYNHYYDECGFNDTQEVWVGSDDTHDIFETIRALDKNNFAVTEDMTVTIYHIYE